MSCHVLSPAVAICPGPRVLSSITYLGSHVRKLALEVRRVRTPLRILSHEYVSIRLLQSRMAVAGRLPLIFMV